MMKPQEYREERIVTRDTNYHVNDLARKGPAASTGVLASGRVVWVAAGSQLESATVSAYAEGVGLVSLAEDCLRPLHH